MLNTLKVALLAGVSVVALAGPAMATPTTVGKGCNEAQTEGGMQTVYTGDWNGNAVAHCINTYELGDGGAVTATNTTKPILDQNGEQVVIDGHKIVTWQSLGNSDGNPKTEVHGTNGVAVGNGATVGSWTPPSCSNGATLKFGQCAPVEATVTEKDGSTTYSCPNGGTLEGGSCKGEVVPGVAHNANDGTALGARTSVQHNHSTAIGADAKSTTDHQVTLGTKGDTLSVPGIVSDLSKSRQTGKLEDGSLEVVTSDKNGNIATDGGAIGRAITNHENRIKATEAKNDEQDDRLDKTEAKNDEQDGNIAANKTRLDEFNNTGGTVEAWADNVNETNAAQENHLNRIDGHLGVLDKKMDKAYEGIAMSLAMESPQVDPGKKFGIAVNWGTFEGENAFAAAGKLRFDNTWSGTAGIGVGSSGTVGGRAGVQAQW